MVAGSSISSVMAAALSVVNSTTGAPIYYANDLIGMFNTTGPKIFVNKSMNLPAAISVAVLLAVVGGFLGFLFGRRYYDDPRMYNAIEKLKKHIEDHRKKYEDASEKKKEPVTSINKSLLGNKTGDNTAAPLGGNKLNLMGMLG